MNVSIGHEFENFVQQKVQSGDFASASEVVRAGLRLLKENDQLHEARLQALRCEMQRGVDSAISGQMLDGPEVMEELRQIVRDRQQQDGE